MNYKEVNDYILLEQIKLVIKLFGNDEAFKIIERWFPNATERLKYRNYFLKAGGQIPETEVE